LKFFAEIFQIPFCLRQLMTKSAMAQLTAFRRLRFYRRSEFCLNEESILLSDEGGWMMQEAAAPAADGCTTAKNFDLWQESARLLQDCIRFDSNSSLGNSRLLMISR
jgi:hypothetical protein